MPQPTVAAADIASAESAAGTAVANVAVAVAWVVHPQWLLTDPFAVRKNGMTDKSEIYSLSCLGSTYMYILWGINNIFPFLFWGGKKVKSMNQFLEPT